MPTTSTTTIYPHYRNTDKWDLYQYTGGGAWRTESQIPRPGRVTFTSPISSTNIKKITIHGSESRIRPDITWNPDEITFHWPRQWNPTLHARFQNYIKSGAALRFVTHTDEEFYGRINTVSVEWILSGKYQKYYPTIRLDVYKPDNLENE